MSGFTDEQRDEIKELIRDVIREELRISVDSSSDYYSKSVSIKLQLNGSEQYWNRETISDDSFNMRDLV